MNKTIAPTTLLLAALFCGTAHAQTDNALRCNGRTDYLQASAHLATTNNFTMEAWVHPTATHQIDRSANDPYAGMNGQRYAIYPTHGTAAWGAGHAGAGISVGTNGVALYEHAQYHIPAVLTYEGAIEGWTHVAVVYRDGTPSLYINGELVKTGTKSGMKYVHPSGGSSSERTWQSGGIGGGAYGYFEGSIDNVRVWDTPMAAGEIPALMGGVPSNAPHLVLNYDMNRSGEGKDLKVTSAGPLNLAGITAGTATTPVFEPRSQAVRSGIEQPASAAPDVRRPATLPTRPAIGERQTPSDVLRSAIEVTREQKENTEAEKATLE